MSDLVNDWLGEYDDFVPPMAGQRVWDFGDFEADDEISRMFNFGAWGGIRPYEFSPDNPFADHPAPLLRGIELFDAGELSDAILAFEAAAQRDMQARPAPAPAHSLSLSFRAGRGRVVMTAASLTAPTPFFWGAASCTTCVGDDTQPTATCVRLRG